MGFPERVWRWPEQSSLGAPSQGIVPRSRVVTALFERSRSLARGHLRRSARDAVNARVGNTPNGVSTLGYGQLPMGVIRRWQRDGRGLHAPFVAVGRGIT